MRGRGSLLDGLVREDPGGFGRGEGFLLPCGEVPLQSGCDSAGVHGVRVDAVGVPPLGGRDREQRVRGFRLGVSDLRVVVPVFEVQVGKIDAGAHVSRRADRDDPGLTAVRGSAGQRVVQAGGEREVPEVVRRELQLPPLRGPGEPSGDNAGIGDEEVQRTVPRVDKTPDACLVGQVEVRNPGARDGGCVADGEGHLGAGGGQRAGRFGADARGSPGHDGADAGEVDAVEHVVRGAGGRERGGDELRCGHLATIRTERNL